MKEYLLFLDESKPQPGFEFFCLAGCIIEEEIYIKKLIPQLNKIKLNVFGDTKVILHEMDIRKAQEPPYNILSDPDKRKIFWEGITEIFTNTSQFEFWTIGVGISCIEYNALYNFSDKSDEYYIGLQVIIENFVHFLELKNGYGRAFIESRNAKEDERMQNHYHALKATGTLFFNKNALQKRLGTLSFPMKTDNNLGLQLVDFIPNATARDLAKKKPKDPSLLSEIKKRCYDGNVKKPDRFGIKVIP